LRDQPEAARVLLEGLAERKVSVRKAALERMKSLPELEKLIPEFKGSVKLLGQILQQEDREVRQLAFSFFVKGRFPVDEVAAFGIIPFCEDPDKDTRLQAIGLVRELAPRAKEALPVLKRLVKGDDQDVALAAAYALARFGPDGVAALNVLMGRVRRLAMDADIGELSAALSLLGRRAVNALAESLGDKDPGTRHAAARILAKIGPDARAAMLRVVEAMKVENDAQVKAALKEAFARLQDKK
jgi:HEAT repeat protein